MSCMDAQLTTRMPHLAAVDAVAFAQRRERELFDLEQANAANARELEPDEA